jgi:serine/threonine-protein kinase
MDEGGMGAIFRAVDNERGDAVAIKVLHPDLAKETRHIARFYREAEAAMALHHPHIVDTRSVGGPGDELCWFAMELIEGRSLHQLQEAGRMVFPPSEVIRIGRQILSALEATHGIGVLHRDLKPGNVMLIERPEGSVAKLVDFGIAVFTSSETYTRLTATGMILGTPAYMPPEQVCGDDLDPRSDVYSLAATLHTILVGEPPYGRGSWGEILPKILTGLRTRLEHRGVDRPLASVIEQGLSVDKEARWGSAREMELALSALDVGGNTTVLQWHPPPEIANLQLTPFDNTGPGFATTMESERPGPFPSTREQPSSNPPPMGPTGEQPSSRPPPPDPVVRAQPESEIRLPTRSRLWPLVALGAVGSFLAAGLVFWALSRTDDETPAPEAVAAEPQPATPAPSDSPSEPTIPVGVEAPQAGDTEEAAAVTEEVPQPVRHRHRSASSRRTAVAQASPAMTPALDEWKEEEVSDAPPPSMSDGPTTSRSIMVNIVSGGGTSVRTTAPRGDPSLVETPGTHGPMVTYRTHRR